MDYSKTISQNALRKVIHLVKREGLSIWKACQSLKIDYKTTLIKLREHYKRRSSYEALCSQSCINSIKSEVEKISKPISTIIFETGSLETLYRTNNLFDVFFNMAIAHEIEIYVPDFTEYELYLLSKDPERIDEYVCREPFFSVFIKLNEEQFNENIQLLKNADVHLFIPKNFFKNLKINSTRKRNRTIVIASLIKRYCMDHKGCQDKNIVFFTSSKALKKLLDIQKLSLTTILILNESIWEL